MERLSAINSQSQASTTESQALKADGSLLFSIIRVYLRSSAAAFLALR
jgi:hypothetical protein